MNRQGLKGAAIGGNVDGVAFSDPKFHPVWAKAEELGVPLFIHPQGVPELNKLLAGNGWLTNAIAYPAETSIALSHLIFEGTFDRFPEAEGDRRPWRRLPAVLRRPFRPRLPGQSRRLRSRHQATKPPTEYLKQIYFDSLVFTPEAIRHLAAQVGAGQIVLGSDYPFPWQLAPVDHIFACDFAERRRQGRHPRPHRGEAVRDGGVGQRGFASGALAALREGLGGLGSTGLYAA